MLKEIDVKKIREAAEENYRDGGMYCSEGIVSAFKETLLDDMPEELIAAASGFPIGVGRSKCMCGVISGGVMCIGYAFGRTTGGQRDKSEKTLELSQELHKKFLARNRVACCSILTHKFEMGSPEHKKQCVRFTGEVAEDLARIIAREKDLPIVGEESKD